MPANRLFLFALLLCPLSLPALMQAQSPSPRPKLDRAGDPLPAGAGIRIGTTRFRHTGVGPRDRLLQGRRHPHHPGGRQLRCISGTPATARRLSSSNRNRPAPAIPAGSCPPVCCPATAPRWPWAWTTEIAPWWTWPRAKRSRSSSSTPTDATASATRRCAPACPMTAKCWSRRGRSLGRRRPKGSPLGHGCRQAPPSVSAPGKGEHHPRRLPVPRRQDRGHRGRAERARG